MVAQATASGGKLSFTMAHKMALMMVAPPKFEYTYTNTDGGGTGIFYKPIAIVWYLPEDFAPYEHGDHYRYIYNGTITIKAIFEEKVFTQELTCDRGTCKELKIDGATTTKQEIKVCNYYLNDGTIISQSNTLTEPQEANLIGYVLYLGQHENDKSDYSATSIGQEKCHGYVISKKIYDNGYVWCPTGKNDSFLADIETITNETNINTIKWWSGYHNTQEAIKYILAFTAVQRKSFKSDLN